MGMITAALGDAGKRMFSPAAILTGGASLAVTGTKAGMDSMKPPKPPPAVAPPQASKAPTRGASGGGFTTPGTTATGTLLTGPGGVDPTRLTTGRSTLLGQ